MKNNAFQRIDLGKKGLQRVFGKLEVAVMRELWQAGQATVRQIHERLKDQGLAYTTVMTVMSRLVSKKVLAREMEGNAFVYRAMMNEEDVRNRLVQELTESFKELSTPALLNFIDHYKTDRETLIKLEKLLAAKKAELE